MTFLRLKYPTYRTEREMAISAILVALLVYLFLALFQPFGTYNYVHTNKYLLLMPYALIALFSFFIVDYIISNRIKDWTWKNEFFKTAFLILLCAVLNYWYSIYFINHADFSFRSLFYMVIFTYTLALPICSIVILGKYIFLKKDNLNYKTNESIIETNTEAISTLTITPDVGEKVLIEKHKLLYAKSAGNYSDIYYLSTNNVEKKTLRISLTNLEKQIGGSSVIRCHRSYVLNLQNVIYKQGNSQGLRITLKMTDQKIPVSRKYINRINSTQF